MASMLPQFDFFTQRSLQPCIDSKFVMRLNPLQSISPLPQSLEFYSAAQPGCYCDLSRAKLRLVLKMTKRDGTDLGAGDVSCGVVCNLADSLFSHFDVLISEKSVCLHGEHYNYKNILQHYSRASDAAIATHFESCLGQIDEVGDDATGPGWTARSTPFRQSRRVELITRLKQDVCSIRNGTYILDNTSIRFRFELADERFYLWSAATPNIGKLQICEAQLLLPFFRANPELTIAVDSALSKTAAQYAFKSCQIKTYICAANTKTIVASNLHTGVLPTLIAIAFVKSVDFQGVATSNPFNFINAGLKRISIFINHEEQRFTCDFNAPQGYTELYESVHAALGTDTADGAHSNQFTLSRYRNGMMVVMVDTSIDNSGNAMDHMNAPLMGTLSIEAELAADLNYSLTMVCLAEHDAQLLIDANRQATVL